MPSDQSVIELIVGVIQDAGFIRSRKMFGEYVIYCDEKVVALICDNQLYIKPTEAGKQYLGAELHEAPPYNGAKLYFLIDEGRWDDRHWMTELIRITAQQLPLNKKKKRNSEPLEY